MKETNINNLVFRLSLLLTGGIALWAVAFNKSFTIVSDAIYNFLTKQFGWLYLAAMLFFVVFILLIAFSKWGKIRLGPDDSRPEYSTVSWFAMLFGAGMGVGLVFWGISEPVSHYIAPMAGIAPASAEAADFAMKASFMHWGIHPWANYAIIGLALAYFQFRKGKPGLISSVLEPVIGTKRRWLNHLVDILAVFATVAGVVTSLGLGVLQINSGLNYLFGIPTSLLIQIIIIAVISVIYIWSAVSGIEKGIKLGADGILSTEALQEVVATPEVGLFVVMQKYPFGMLLSLVALVLLCTFFITSANSGTFVLSMLTSDGALNPPNNKKVLWGIVQSVMAVGLLIAGGLKPLQIISIAAAFPFIFIMLFTCVSLVKALRDETV